MDARYRKWERRFEIPVALAALATIPLLVAEQNHHTQPLATLLTVGDWLVWTVFAAEAVVLMALTTPHWRWARSHVLEVAIVVLTIPVIPGAIQALRTLRLLRLLRLVRLAPVARRVFSLEGLRYATFLALLAVLAGGEAFAQAENVSLGNGIYWALSTMTTVGYGDFIPKTSAGKAVAATVMMVGVAFFAMITGAIAQSFLAGEVEEIEEEVQEMVAETEREERMIESAQTQMLEELHDLAQRLQSLEERLRGHLGAGTG
ncbi:MAG: potassium channel family protein [Solirubrobacteraceae bacterium]